MEQKKYTWEEMCKLLRGFNKERGYTFKGNPEQLIAVAVITEDSFSSAYTLQERSYKFTSDNKAFIPSLYSNSIFSNCLDGKDMGVRLDYYIPDEWKVEYCYLVEE